MSEFQFIVDSREKLPWSMPDALVLALKTGDYSLKGFEEVMSIERKSYDDLYQCLTNRARNFKQQLKRLGKLKHSAVLIESTLAAFLLGHIHYKLSGADALDRLIRFTMKENVPFNFCGRDGSRLASVMLYYWWLDEQKK